MDLMLKDNDHKYWNVSQDDKFTTISEFDERLFFKIENSKVEFTDHVRSPIPGKTTYSFCLVSRQMLVLFDGGAFVSDPQNELDKQGELILYEWHQTMEEVSKLILASNQNCSDDQKQYEHSKNLMETMNKLSCFSTAGCVLADTFMKILGNL